MKKKYFGTDGIRGVANRELTPELSFRLGIAAGRYILQQGGPPKIVIGRDTRRSGSMIGASVASGFCSVGVSVTSLGIVPTGCISYAARSGEYGLGVMISASHNPAADNGIKLLDSSGKKLSDEVELEIESLIDLSSNAHSLAEGQYPEGQYVGEILKDDFGKDTERYIEFLKSILPEGLHGMQIAVDGAHGAAYCLAAELFRSLGAKVIEVGHCPTGMNINDGVGATYPSSIQKLTLESQSDIGVAFDGDADRAIFSDSKGRLINGDRTMAIWTSYQLNQGLTGYPQVVGTVMSNGGFASFLRSKGVELIRTSVGDRYVSQKIDELNALVGGEQSGHIIFPQRAPTGDGLITALELFCAVHLSDRDSDSFFEEYENWPQIMYNIRVQNKDVLENSNLIQETVRKAEQALGHSGRINVRPSGTQPFIRMMIEAESVELRDCWAEDVSSVILAECGGEIEAKVDLTHSLGE